MISTELKRELSLLFTVLEYGERLAHDCARQQALLLPEGRERRFLQAQARQEKQHAWLFNHMGQWIDPHSRFAVPEPMVQLRQRLELALRNKDLTDTLVGSQVALEGLGEQVLARLNAGIDARGIGFKRLRHLFHRQEQSHQAFGLRMLEKRRAGRDTDVCRLPALCSGYLQQIEMITDSMSEVFEALGQDAHSYSAAAAAALPDWLRGRTA